MQENLGLYKVGLFLKKIKFDLHKVKILIEKLKDLKTVFICVTFY